MFTKKSPKLSQFIFKKLKKSYANKKNTQKPQIRPLWSKHVFLVILVKTLLGNQKMDIYKCPKSVFPKKSWKKINLRLSTFGKSGAKF